MSKDLDALLQEAPTLTFEPFSQEQETTTLSMENNEKEETNTIA